MKLLKRFVVRILRAKKGSHEADKPLLVIIWFLLIFGLISLASASSVVSYVNFEGDAYYYFKHQLFGLGVGLVAFWFFSQIDYNHWRSYASAFLLFSIVLLCSVFIPGLSRHYGKARSWINVFGFSLQPSEIVKLSFLFYLAAWIEARKEDLKQASKGIFPFVFVLSFIAFLMILQPDIGTLSIVTLTSLVVFFVGGGDIKHILVIVIIGSLVFAGLVGQKEYIQERIKCTVDPSFSPDDICYQTNQSLIAVGSGGFFGRGLGGSRQKFLYLPELNGDSIFAIIAEEMGMLISGILILAFLALFYRGYYISKHAADEFGRILAIGIVTWLTLQALINIGGITNFMPMTGVPLPLISYGGSAILAALSALGILVNISKQTKI